MINLLGLHSKVSPVYLGMGTKKSVSKYTIVYYVYMHYAKSRILALKMPDFRGNETEDGSEQEDLEANDRNTKRVPGH